MPSRRAHESELRNLRRERDLLRRDLHRLSQLFESFVQTRRWRFGNAVGNVAQRMPWRQVGPKAIDSMEAILRRRRPDPRRASREVRRAKTTLWLAELCDDLSRLLGTRRWRIGMALLRPYRGLHGGSDRHWAWLRQHLVQARQVLRQAAPSAATVETVLGDLAGAARTVLASPEWRCGKAVGDVVASLLMRPEGESAESRMRALVADYDRWLQHLPHVSRERDRRLANDRYALYVAEVEPARFPEITGGRPASVRAVVLPDPAGRSSRPDPRHLLGSVTAVTVLVRSDTLLRSPEDPRVEQVEVAAEQELVAVLNARLARWEEEFLVVVDGSDRLSSRLARALGEVAEGAPVPPLAIVFDHDHLTADGRRVDPELKPGFSPELLLEWDYLGRAVAFHRGGLLEAGGFSDAGGHFVRATLWKGFVERRSILKRDQVLLHAAAEEEGALEAPRDERSELELVRWAVRQRGLGDLAIVRWRPHGPQVRFPLPPDSLVSIVIAFTDKADLLRQALDSIARLTSHPRFEVVLVDAGSRDPATLEYLEELRDDPRVTLVRFDERFNYSRVNNLGAARARGDFLVFLNNDVRLLTPDWLEQMCGYASLADIGAVGAKLLYADGSIQHAGVVVGMTGYANHLFSGEHEAFLPASWLRPTRNFSAVTGACLAIERCKFEEMGGFDERLTLTGNDVDLCLRLLKSGRRNLVIPSVTLFHYEKSTRKDHPVRDYNKRLSLYTYREMLGHGDPYYNANLSLETTRLLPKTRAEVVTPATVAPASGEGPLGRASQFVGTYDLTRAEMAANREVTERFLDERRVTPATITWFVPHFDHVYRGGIYTVMRIADHFTRRSGTLNRFVFYGRGGGDLAGMERQIGEAFPEMKRDLVLLRPGDSEADLPPADLAFCTLWTSAYHLARYNQCRGKLYLVQDFEGGFSQENSVFGLAEETYRLGFVGVANTPGVCETYRRYGSEAEYFVPSVDRTVFSPATVSLPTPPTRVVFYGRPDKPRNAFALGVEALRELKRRHGDRVEILAAGAEFDVCDYALEGVLVNLGLLPDVHSVASLYRHSHVGLVFMLSKHPSYQPFEYMASGCAVVSNVNEANAWFLRDRENCLAVPPLRTAVVEAIEELMEDEDLRRSLVRRGLETVSQTSWEAELEVIHGFVTRGERRSECGWAPGIVKAASG